MRHRPVSKDQGAADPAWARVVALTPSGFGKFIGEETESRH
jgi:hypothetical protein